jgi:leucyl aminopeptidase (aminopeptidase T)
MMSVKPLALSFLLPCLAFAAPPAAAPAPAKPADFAVTAERILGDVLGVKAGEVVAIDANPGDLAMVEALYVACGQRGALPLTRIEWPEMHKKWLQTVPEVNDATRAALEEKLIPLVDVRIFVERADDPALFKDVAPSRITAFEKTLAALGEKRMKRKMRSVWLGNGLTPSKANAKQLKLTEAELSSIFWAGVGTDYRQLASRAEAVMAAVPETKQLVITTPGGTNLKLRLKSKTLNFSDGVISPEELKEGGAKLLTWLPAGEVYALIDPTSAEGKIVVTRHLFEGEDVNDLTLTIAGGKVTAMTAKPSKAFDRLKQLFDASPAGKDSLSVLDFGVNADVKAPKGKQLLSFVPAGAVTLFVGRDGWAGGKNNTTFDMTLFLPDATVTADGTPVVEKGELKVSQ